MFIERLTKEQLCVFFEVKSISTFLDKSMYEDEKHLHASYSTSMSVNMRLYDFEGSTVSSQTKWRRYLYSIFGDEYLQEYSKWLDEQKEKKLKEIINI